MSWWLIYIWTRLDLITTGCCVILVLLSILFGVGTLCAVVARSDGADEDYNLLVGIGKKLLLIISIAASILLLVPNKKDMAMIYVIPKMVHSDTFTVLSKEMPELTKFGIDALKEQLKELSDKKED